MSLCLSKDSAKKTTGELAYIPRHFQSQNKMEERGSVWNSTVLPQAKSFLCLLHMRAFRPYIAFLSWIRYIGAVAIVSVTLATQIPRPYKHEYNIFSRDTTNFFFFFVYPCCLVASGPQSIAWKQFYLEPVSSHLLKFFFPPGRLYHTLLPSFPWSSSVSSFLPSGFHCLFWFSVILHSYHMTIPLHVSSFYIL